MVLVTLVIFILSMNISIVTFLLWYICVTGWKCIKLVLLLLRDSLFNLNREDMLMSLVLIIYISVLTLWLSNNIFCNCHLAPNNFFSLCHLAQINFSVSHSWQQIKFDSLLFCQPYDFILWTKYLSYVKVLYIFFL